MHHPAPPRQGSPPSDDAAPPPLSVDAALTTLAPRFRTETPVTVAGKVQAVRTYEPWHYVDLSGTDAQLTCRLPAAAAPPEPGHALVVHGALSVQPSRFKGGLEVLLTGEVVGTYRQAALPRSRRPLTRAHTPQRLSWSVAHDPLPRIAVVATATGWEDARRALLSHDAPEPWTHVPANFGSRDEILRLVERLGADPGWDAVALLRGGGDARALDMWDDPDLVEALLAMERPFYTALGHSTHLLLADRYADESFDTPTAFGHALGQLLEAELARRLRLDAARAERDALARELDEARAAAREGARERRTLLRLAIGLAAASALLLAALVLA
ncbi:MAG TPA: exodeoxyribonuclease VII large subunit [Longimicrobium sp.]|nr:exodeoxyribonuclease VII large subunit [Longimicrobium sp.]